MTRMQGVGIGVALSAAEGRVGAIGIGRGSDTSRALVGIRVWLAALACDVLSNGG